MLGHSAMLNCTKPQMHVSEKDLHDFVIGKLLNRIGTVKVNTNGTEYSLVGSKEPVGTNGKGRRIGVISRRRLCLYPAILLLGSISLLTLSVEFCVGSHDLAWKLWLYLSLAAGMDDTNTPLSTKFTEIQIFNQRIWGGNMFHPTFDGQQLDIEERPRLPIDISPEEYIRHFHTYK